MGEIVILSMKRLYEHMMYIISIENSCSVNLLVNLSNLGYIDCNTARGGSLNLNCSVFYRAKLTRNGEGIFKEIPANSQFSFYYPMALDLNYLSVKEMHSIMYTFLSYRCVIYLKISQLVMWSYYT